MKVAIVDDELKMRQIMTDYVKRFGEEAGNRTGDSNLRIWRAVFKRL